ncbi:MAG: thiamine phosphate synthase [Desulfuromonas sp.]|nr:MAG: thiamine phosphate synthase [Desulfuromonas sp.]
MAERVDFSLYLISDRKAVPEGKDLLEVLEAALLGGVRAVQLREKDLDAARLLPLARQLRELTGDYQAKLLINDRIDVALAVEADGVHLGSHSLPIAVARKLLGPDRLIGVSTHNHQQIHAAVAGGANFITFGPIWYTLSKTLPGEPVGPEALKEACRQSTVPVFALGGVTPKGIPELHAAGCHHVACIGGILQQEDPTAASRAFLAQLDA